MNIKKHIPNFLTCCNLICGCLGIIETFHFGFTFGGGYPNLILASFLVFLACIFDFLDGFAARILKVQSPIGKELDSLADVVTFGVLPGFMIYVMISNSLMPGWDSTIVGTKIALIALLIPIFSALRLAKFNVDTRQSESFIGVPTPANAILIASLPLIIVNNISLSGIILNPYFLVGLSILMSYLLVAELPLFALKFKTFKWAGNEIRFVFLALSILLLAILKWLGIPIIIFLYIILSVINNVISKKALTIDNSGLK
jgi:CDP-diacylglycerol---serine O-phosphatidyltransferase